MLPPPSRLFPHADNPVPSKTFAEHSARVAANAQRMYEMTISHLGNIGGSADAITAQCAPPLTEDPAHGQTFRLVPTANNTTAVTVNIDGRGAIDLRDDKGDHLSADMLVAGVAAEFWMDTVAGYLKLAATPLAELVSLVADAISGAMLMEQIGDATIAGSTALVEFSFIPDRYSRVYVVASDIVPVSVNGTEPTITLRNASTAIVSLQGGDSAISVDPRTWTATFAMGLHAATKRHAGQSFGMNAIGNYSTATAVGSNAVSADRVRVHMGVNMAGGRVVAYGLRAGV